MEAAQHLDAGDGHPTGPTHHPGRCAEQQHAANADRSSEGVAGHQIAGLGQGAFGVTEDQHGPGAEGDGDRGAWLRLLSSPSRLMATSAASKEHSTWLISKQGW